MPGKYYNKKVNDPVYGVFDSMKEHKRWLELLAMQERGEISNLRRQVEYTLIPSQDGTERHESPCRYNADFTYTDMDGNDVVEDSKGARTTEYIIKRKLMLYIHGISIVES